VVSNSSQRFALDRVVGTQFTMEQEFYKGRLVEKFGLNVLIPTETERAIVHCVIYDELYQGKILPQS